MKASFAALLMSALAVSACSSITEGTSQVISVSTNPAGADCALVRQGIVIGRVNPTPGQVKIDKTKHDINVECTKEGFAKASYFNKSDVAGMTAGNLILGGAIGWAIDSATGADNKYDGSVHLEFKPAADKSLQAPAVPPQDGKAPAVPTS